MAVDPAGAPGGGAEPPGGAGPVDGVVLAGGSARRMGGGDKTAARVGGEELLDRAVRSLLDAGARTVVVVGPRGPRTLPDDRAARVLLTREDPPGGGPVPALLAGLQALDTAGRGAGGLVVVLPGDLPHVDGATVARLVAAGRRMGEGTDAVVPLDREGREQWLSAVYRPAALQRALAAASGDGTGRTPGLRDVVRAISWTTATDGSGWGRLADVDTPEQLNRAHLEAWTVGLAARWGLEPSLGDLLDEPGGLVADVLDVAKEAAHTVARPAAPLTTFLLGLALARRDEGTDPGELLERLRAELAEELDRARGAEGGATGR